VTQPEAVLRMSLVVNTGCDMVTTTVEHDVLDQTCQYVKEVAEYLLPALLLAAGYDKNNVFEEDA
jgi:hypothetical protein